MATKLEKAQKPKTHQKHTIRRIMYSKLPLLPQQPGTNRRRNIPSFAADPNGSPNEPPNETIRTLIYRGLTVIAERGLTESVAWSIANVTSYEYRTRLDQNEAIGNCASVMLAYCYLKGGKLYWPKYLGYMCDPGEKYKDLSSVKGVRQRHFTPLMHIFRLLAVDDRGGELFNWVGGLFYVTYSRCGVVKDGCVQNRIKAYLYKNFTQIRLDAAKVLDNPCTNKSIRQAILRLSNKVENIDVLPE